MLCAGFGEHKRAIGKIESCQTLPSRQFCSLLSPVQAAGNHQMQHQPKIALHSDDYSLAIRRSSRTTWPSTSEIDGSMVRRKKGLANRICWIGCATIRDSSAWI